MNPTQYERMWARGSKVLSILALTHPTGVLVFGATTLLLSVIAQKHTVDIGLCLRITLAMVFAQAGSGVINDLCDVDLDSIAKPWRALPARLISIPKARALAAALVLLAVLASALVSAVSCLLLVCGVVTSVLYSALLKRTPLSWLPYVVAYPSLPIWVWISAGAFQVTILAVYLLGAPLVIAVHLVNQLRDYDEDEKLGVRGLVHALGRPRAIAACYLLMAIGPIPLLLTGLQSSNAASAWLLWGAALVHWSLVVPLIIGGARHRDVADFRRIFRAFQLSVPLLTVAWLIQV